MQETVFGNCPTCGSEIMLLGSTGTTRKTCLCDLKQAHGFDRESETASAMVKAISEECLES